MSPWLHNPHHHHPWRERFRTRTEFLRLLLVSERKAGLLSKISNSFFYIIRLRTRTALLPIDVTRKRTITVPIPYLPRLIDTIADTLRNTIWDQPFTLTSNLIGYCVMARTSPSPLSKSGVYLLRYRDCDCVYIRECKRAFHTQIKEYTSAHDTNQSHRSAFARHLLEENHREGDEEILHVERNRRRRLALESIKIVKHETRHRYKVLNRTTVSEPLIFKVFAFSLHYKETERLTSYM